MHEIRLLQMCIWDALLDSYLERGGILERLKRLKPEWITTDEETSHNREKEGPYGQVVVRASLYLLYMEWFVDITELR
ncbi:unnamed protein product [Enterobius vermicularis]|uniref:Nuclear pore complex protein n=1 Tax=Enterobius vermicularis TaxID=51028 RepID=A0A0N4V0X7_ENTVE|nr:unnamed protein product [Enterobius vermicularis]